MVEKNSTRTKQTKENPSCWKKTKKDLSTQGVVVFFGFPSFAHSEEQLKKVECKGKKHAHN